MRRRGPSAAAGLSSGSCPSGPTPKHCVEAYYLQWTRFESMAERKIRRRQLTGDGNVEDQRARVGTGPRLAAAPGYAEH